MEVRNILTNRSLERYSPDELVPTMRKIYLKMARVERLKTLPPKYTKSLSRLVRFLGLDRELIEDV